MLITVKTGNKLNDVCKMCVTHTELHVGTIDKLPLRNLACVANNSYMHYVLINPPVGLWLFSKQ